MHRDTNDSNTDASFAEATAGSLFGRGGRASSGKRADVRDSVSRVLAARAHAIR